MKIDGGAGADTIKNGDSISTSYKGGSSITIDGGDGNDSIYDAGSYVTIDGGAGDDSIDSNGSYGLIDGGAGNDLIGLYGNYHITVNAGTDDDTVYINRSYYSSLSCFYQYAYGDGNDIVHNFSAKDTIQISGSYATQTSGSDIIVSVGSGSITLKDYYGTVNIQSTSNGNAAVPWFTEDDTLTTGDDLDSLIETSIANSVSDLSMRGANSNELANLEQPAITFNTNS